MNLENNLVEAIVYDVLNKLPHRNMNYATAAESTTPDYNTIITQINDQFKTFLRFKAEAKYLTGTTGYVNFKDSNKNHNTIYFEI